MMFGLIFNGHSIRSEQGVHCLEGTRCHAASLYVTALATLCALLLARVAEKLDQKHKENIYKSDIGIRSRFLHSLGL